MSSIGNPATFCANASHPSDLYDELVASGGQNGIQGVSPGNLAAIILENNHAGIDHISEFDLSFNNASHLFDLGLCGELESNDQLIYYFSKDQLGSSNYITDRNGEVVQHLEYMPFGELFVDEQRIINDERFATPYRFNGKEKDSETGLYYYGTRYYDAKVSRFLSVDPLAEKYASISPYAYVANNPLNAIDPDGRRIIFVNGFLGFGSPTGGATYWGGKNSKFVKGAQSFYGDNDVRFTNISHGKYSSVKSRMQAGRAWVKDNYADLTKGLSKDSDDFKFVTHSMGAAFAEGAIEYLKEEGWNVTQVAHLEAYQADDINANTDPPGYGTDENTTIGTTTIDYQLTNDPVLNQPLNNLRMLYVRKIVLLTLSFVFITSLIYGQLKKYPQVNLASETSVGEEVTFYSNKIKLNGNLLLPETKNKKYPAVIFAIGSGSDSYKLDFRPNDKIMFWKDLSDILLEMGYAVLFIEKRGVNGSEGNWQKNTIKGRAKDVKAGIDFLKNLDHIDTSKIGLLGHSQGGWVIQQAAVDYRDDVSFIINLSGAASSVIEQEIDNLSGEWRCNGMDEKKVIKKSKSLRFKLKMFRAFSWLIKTNHFSRIIRHDPQKKILAGIECPVLAIYGENDVLVPIEKNIKSMEAGIKDTTKLKIIRIKGVTHSLSKGELCSRYDSKETIDNKISQEVANAISVWEHLKY